MPQHRRDRERVDANKKEGYTAKAVIHFMRGHQGTGAGPRIYLSLCNRVNVRLELPHAVHQQRQVLLEGGGRLLLETRKLSPRVLHLLQDEIAAQVGLLSVRSSAFLLLKLLRLIGRSESLGRFFVRARRSRRLWIHL